MSIFIVEHSLQQMWFSTFGKLLVKNSVFMYSGCDNRFSQKPWCMLDLNLLMTRLTFQRVLMGLLISQ